MGQGAHVGDPSNWEGLRQIAVDDGRVGRAGRLGAAASFGGALRGGGRPASTNSGAGRGAVLEAAQCGPRSCSGLPCSRDLARPACPARSARRRRDWVHRGCRRPHHGSLLRGRRRIAADPARSGRARLTDPVHGHGDSRGALHHCLLALQRRYLRGAAAVSPALAGAFRVSRALERSGTEPRRTGCAPAARDPEPRTANDASGRARKVEGVTYYDLWTSFTPRSTNLPESRQSRTRNDELVLSAYEIQAQVDPPTTLTATAVIHAEVKRSGERVLYFELSRFLQVKEVEADGRPVEFINNPAMDGTQLARRGNDLVAVVFPEVLEQGRKLNLRFCYRGDVLSEAGGGLLYVGARGTWYPNRGLAMSNFDLQFRYPAEWTLVATGKKVSAGPAAGSDTSGEQTSRWISERPVALAGFNLGRYDHATARAGEVTVDAYAARAMEKDFPRPAPVVASPAISSRPGAEPVVVQPMLPSPARNAQKVADLGARSIQFFSQLFGAYPYGSLELAQMPGRVSQGWPGLVFLSSFAFLTPEQAEELSPGAPDSGLNSLILPHEIAHQWWGDLVGWQTYRDQWIVEALAN